MDKVWSQSQIEKIAEGFNTPRDRALFIIEYLTGGRVSELINRVRKSDIEFVKKEGREFLIITLPYTEKNKKHPTRLIPCPIDREGGMIKFLSEYLNLLNPDDLLFTFTRQRAYQIIKKVTGKKQHWLRHCRLTHLVTVYDFNDRDLVQFAGWTDSRPASSYIKLRWQDLASKM